MVTPRELLRHALGAGVGRIGQDRGHQCGFVARGVAGAIVGEAVEKAGPAVDFGQQAGDPDAGDERVEPAAERGNPVTLFLADQADRQSLVVKGGVGDRAALGRVSERLQAALERRGPLLAPDIEAVWHGQSETLLGAHELEGRPWQKVILEAAPSAAALHPYVAGAEPVAQMDEDRHLPGADIEITVRAAYATTPFAGQEGQRHRFRQSATPVYHPQQLDRLEDLVACGTTERKMSRR